MNRNVDFLFQRSNAKKAGKWIFCIGSKENEFFQVQKPDIYVLHDDVEGKLTKRGINQRVAFLSGFLPVCFKMLEFEHVCSLQFCIVVIKTEL